MPDVAVPTALPLSALRRVELIDTGQWKISSGEWNASREDLVAAVAALDCRAVRRPVLKLGHSKGEQPLWEGNPTGAPAVGWVDNLALTNQGHTLVGDFVGMPGWLGDIAASAYPDRSVEGTYDMRCQIGHTHPFVLTAVAFLGVTPPGVGTLRSLQDVGALYGVGGTHVVAFDSDQPRWPEGTPGGLGGQWRDLLKLASRIRLGGGESLVGSASVNTEDGAIPLAAVRTPDGVRLRVGIGILDEDRGRWAGANRGATVDLPPAQVGELRETLSEMAQLGQLGAARRADLESRADQTKARERDLYRSQFKLTKAQAKDLDRIDSQLESLESRRAHNQARITERVRRMPADEQDRYHRSTPAEQQQVIKDWYGSQPEWRRVGVEFLHARNASDLARLDQETRAAEARRAELTANPTRLSAADAAELERLRMESADLETQIGSYIDGTTLAEGVIPGDWGDLVYRVDADEAGISYRLSVRSPAAPDTWLPGGDFPGEASLTEVQLRQLGAAINGLLSESTEAPVAAAAVDHLEGVTLGDSEVDLDLWDDATVSLGWDQHTTTLDPDDAGDLVEALNLVRGGVLPQDQVRTADAVLVISGAHGGDLRLSTDLAAVVLSDDDAFDLQSAIVDWYTGQPVQARAWSPKDHPRWPKGTPGGLGGRFMPKDLVGRKGSGPSRSTRRSSPPARDRSPAQRRTRSRTTTPEQVSTINSLTSLDERLRRVPGTTRARGRQRSLSREVRETRADVDAGRITRTEAADRLEQVAQRPDVASDDRLEGYLYRTITELRGRRDGSDNPPPPTRRDTPTPVPDRPSGRTSSPGYRPELSDRPEVDRRVLEVVEQLSPGAETIGVPIADVRDRLADLSPEELDDALRRLALPGPEGLRPVMLTGAEAQLMLPDRVRNAALDFANEPRHYVWFNSDDLGPPGPAPSLGQGGVPDLVSRLRGSGSRTEAESLLTGMNVAELKQTARDAEIAFPANIRRGVLVDLIVQWTIGRRLDSDVISRPGPVSGPLGPRGRVGASVDAAADVATGALVALLPSEEIWQIQDSDGAVVIAQADRNQLKHYWTRDPRGLARWVTSPHPWTALYRQLRKHVGAARAKRIASSFFKEVFGIWPGERKGQNPAGPG